MHSQLMEELPKFWMMGKRYLSRLLRAFLALEHRFVRDAGEVLLPVRNPDLCNSDGTQKKASVPPATACSGSCFSTA